LFLNSYEFFERVVVWGETVLLCGNLIAGVFKLISSALRPKLFFFHSSCFKISLLSEISLMLNRIPLELPENKLIKTPIQITLGQPFCGRPPQHWPEIYLPACMLVRTFLFTNTFCWSVA
jgi:hypothetical protein